MNKVQKAISALPAALALLGASIVSAQTTTPGVPSTGAGGDATGLWVILGLAAIVVLAAGAYLYGTART